MNAKIKVNSRGRSSNKEEKEEKVAPKKKRGRPKGSTNKKTKTTTKNKVVKVKEPAKKRRKKSSTIEIKSKKTTKRGRKPKKESVTENDKKILKKIKEDVQENPDDLKNEFIRELNEELSKKEYKEYKGSDETPKPVRKEEKPVQKEEISEPKKEKEIDKFEKIDNKLGPEDIYEEPEREVKKETPSLKVYKREGLVPMGGTDPEPEEEISEPKKSVGIYRKIALMFILLTVGLLAMVFYFVFVKVTIVLIPNQERISNNMIIDIFDKEVKPLIVESKVKGIVRKEGFEDDNNYTASGEEIVGEEVVGEVTIYNYYNRSQPLVATTRLLSTDNRLYRIKETVDIPAGGSAVVAVYADEAIPEMEIDPTKFTSPGLWAGLQDKIYAESSEKITYQKKIKKHIIKSDIDNGIRDLKQQLIKSAKASLSNKYKEYGQMIFSIDENSLLTEVDGKIGEEVDSFRISISADVIVVAFDNDGAADLARKKFVTSLPLNKELIEFDSKNIIYTLNGYNHNDGTASVNTTFEGKVSLKKGSEDIVDRGKILGLNDQQLRAYLTDINEIAGFEVDYFPTFIKRVPKLIDRIEIKIKR